MDLCGPFINGSSMVASQQPFESRSNELHFPKELSACDYTEQNMQQENYEVLRPIDESPQTQISQLFPMMWPNVTALEAAGEVIDEDAWLEFLKGGAMVE